MMESEDVTAGVMTVSEEEIGGGGGGCFDIDFGCRSVCDDNSDCEYN